MRLKVRIILQYLLNGFCCFIVGGLVVLRMPDEWAGNPITGHAPFWSDILLMIITVLLMVLISRLFKIGIKEDLVKDTISANWLTRINIVEAIGLILSVIYTIINLNSIILSSLMLIFIILGIILMLMNLYQTIITKNINWYHYGVFDQMLLVLIFWLSFWVTPV